MRFVLNALALCIVGFGGSDVITHDTKGDFSLRYRSGPVNWGTKTTFDLVGSPSVLVQKHSSGFQLSSRRMTGAFHKMADETFSFDQLDAMGDAETIFDSNQVIQYAKAHDLKTTEEPDAHTVLNSETLSVGQKADPDSADFSLITTTMVHPYKLDDRRKGRLKPDPKGDPKALGDPFTRDTVYTGSSGTFTFKDPKKKKGVAKLTSGESDGPIHFHSTQIIRSKGPDGPVKKEMDVTADHLSADMSKSSDQIVLKGHVVFSDSDLDLQGSCDQITLTVDDDGNITKFVTTGEPATGSVVPDPVKS